MSRASEADLTYLRLKKVFGGRNRKALTKNESGEAPFSSGRDPRILSEALTHLTTGLGWDDQLAKSRLVNDWAGIVGEEIANHATPHLEDSILVLKCSSTAWAVNLRMMRSQLIGTIREACPELTLSEIRTKGPDAPNWKTGPRSTPGRGPRDTYG